MGDVNITSLLVIVAAVVATSGNCGPLLCIGSHKVNVWVGVDLCLFQGGELSSVQSQSLIRSEWAAHFAAVDAIPGSMRARGFDRALTGFSAVTNEDGTNVLTDSLTGHHLACNILLS